MTSTDKNHRATEFARQIMSLGILSMAENEEAPRKQLIFIKNEKRGFLIAPMWRIFSLFVLVVANFKN